MDYEKKYKDALEWARRVMEGKVGFVLDEVLEKFPELKESEDERIRKEIIDFATKANNGVTSILANNYNFNKWIAWLGKQGSQNLANSAKTCKDEQKLAWSEEDEEMRIKTLHHLSTRCSVQEYEEIEDWLKSIKNRVQPKSKHEWCEEDERMRNVLIRACHYMVEHFENSTRDYEDAINWLKSFKERYTWKPSDEQMHILKWVANILLHDNGVVEQEASKKLNSLYEDLKKL